MMEFANLLSRWIDENHPTWCLIRGNEEQFWFIRFKRTGRTFFEVDKLTISGIESGMSFTHSKINDLCDSILKNFKVTAADPNLFMKLNSAICQIEFNHLDPLDWWKDFTNKRSIEIYKL